MVVPARSFVLSVEASRILASGPCWNAPSFRFGSGGAVAVHNPIALSSPFVTFASHRRLPRRVLTVCSFTEHLVMSYDLKEAASEDAPAINST
jgi:hypothetical protein